jgi:hypothetical protein
MGNIGPNFKLPEQPPRRPPNTPQAGVLGGSDAVYAAPSQAAGLNDAIPLERLLVQGSESLASLLAQSMPMNLAQWALLLRNLLQMPREMVQLLALLSELDEGATKALLQTLLTENPRISLEDLQRFLTTRMDKSQEKLLQLLQSGLMGLGGGGKEAAVLLNSLSELVFQARQSPADALQTTLVLYLPFYPLHGPQRFSLHFEPPEEGEEDGYTQEAQLVIFIETISLGKLRISLSVLYHTQLQALVEHDPEAAGVLDALRRQMNATMAEENLPPPDLIFKQRAGRLSNKGQTASSSRKTFSGKPEGQSVGIHPVGGVSAMTIHLAYWLIRIVLELDSRHALTLQRTAQSP